MEDMRQRLGLEESAGKEFDEACRIHRLENLVPQADHLYDMEVTPSEMTRSVGVELSTRMHPYCEDDNPEPVFMVRNVTINSVKVREGADWRLVVMTGSSGGQEIPMRMKMFTDDHGEELVGRNVDIVFSFPQRDDPRWGMDISVVEIIGG
jgi:single-stranded DNA-specific DHH superfamily exonuclease